MTCPTISAPHRSRLLPFVLLTRVLAAGAVATTAQAQTPATGTTYHTSQHDFRLEKVADLVHPHSMAFTPEGDMLITERPGRLRIVRQGQLLPTPVAGLPDILYLGNGATAQDGST
jgi:aldose sugar dehydrogenase